MQATGALLQAHIRWEEHSIFPLIEQSMPEDALADLARQLAGRPSPRPSQAHDHALEEAARSVPRESVQQVHNAL
jgi:hypothetical protein